MITPYVEFKDGHKEPIKILGVGEREIVFVHRDIIYCCVTENNGFYPVFYPDPNEDLSDQFDALSAIKGDDLETPTRFPNCPMCKSYDTDYPYCDMCIEGNKFEYAGGPTYKAGDKILYKGKEREILSDSISIKEEQRSFDEIVDLSASCLICGEPVPIDNPRDYPKICEKCKEAVMFVREKIENDPERFIDEYLAKE